jgi:hypothetical protein
MTISSDNSTRRGAQGLQFAVPQAFTRHCMPGSHHVSNRQGGSMVRYRGVRVWCCAGCTTARAEKARAVA